MNISGILYRISAVSYILSAGGAIGKILVYSYKRWGTIIDIKDVSFQTTILLLILSAYFSFSMALLVVKKRSGVWLGFDYIFLALSSGFMLFVFFNCFSEEQPFELVYVLRDVSLIILSLCIFHILYLKLENKEVG